jgi:hypothetical protein
MEEENIINPTPVHRSDRNHSTAPNITPPNVTRIARNASVQGLSAAGRTLL